MREGAEKKSRCGALQDGGGGDDRARRIPGPSGKICTKLCVDSCPDGFQCAGTGATGDVTFICIPRWQHLCDPCTENAGCVDPLLGAGAQCLDYGADGAFCGTSCAKEADCPTGYACSGEPGPGGKLVGQCRRTSGLCSCSVSAVAAKLATSCSHASPFGVCKGIRGCGEQGLSPCTAAIPRRKSAMPLTTTATVAPMKTSQPHPALHPMLLAFAQDKPVARRAKRLAPPKYQLLGFGIVFVALAVGFAVTFALGRSQPVAVVADVPPAAATPTPPQSTARARVITQQLQRATPARAHKRL